MDYTTVKAYLISKYNSLQATSTVAKGSLPSLDEELQFVSDLINAANVQPKKPTMLDYLWKWSSKKK